MTQQTPSTAAKISFWARVTSALILPIGNLLMSLDGSQKQVAIIQKDTAIASTALNVAAAESDGIDAAIKAYKNPGS